jgi:hypothetical protein
MQLGVKGNAEKMQAAYEQLLSELKNFSAVLEPELVR